MIDDVVSREIDGDDTDTSHASRQVFIWLKIEPHPFGRNPKMQSEFRLRLRRS